MIKIIGAPEVLDELKGVHYLFPMKLCTCLLNQKNKSVSICSVEVLITTPITSPKRNPNTTPKWVPYIRKEKTR